jgi:hypothetical protein
MGKLFDTQLSLEQLRFTLKHQTVLTTKTVVARFRGAHSVAKSYLRSLSSPRFYTAKIKL